MLNIIGITNSTSRNGSGVSSAMMELYKKIDTSENKVFVFSNKDDFSEIDIVNWAGIKVNPIQKDKYSTPLNINHRLYRELKYFVSSLSSSDTIMHLHGLWQYTSLVTNKISRKSQIPYIISPHGMLDDYILKRNSYKKVIARALFENRNLRESNVLHALTENEKANFEKLGLKNKIAIIPNGVSLPSTETKVCPWNDDFIQGRKVLLYVSRIHPKKGLSNLMLAFNELSKETDFFDNWCVVIGGWDQLNHKSQLENLLLPELKKSVLFPGGLVGELKDAAFKNADCFILPSLSEGLPVSVLEAWSYKLPVLMTTHCNLSYAFNEGAAIKIDPTVKSIYDNLKTLNVMNGHELKEIGEKGLTIVNQRYTWEIISNQFVSLYNYVLDSCSSNKPDFMF